MKLRIAPIVAALALSAFSMPALAADKATVSGVVKNGDGDPVAKATVQLLHREGKKLVETDSATTDSRGRFKIEDVDNGTYVVVASTRDNELRDRSEITVHDGRDPDALTFEVRRGRELREEERAAEKSERRGKNYTQLTGTIYNSDKKPARGATVRLYTGDADADTNKLVEVADTTTDERGNFVFEKIPATHYILIAKKGGEEVRHTVNLNADNKTENVRFTMK
jgi:5-hydroxyisourate hydrolase-like protein (transthyretin family)